ncbi:MAG TPA: hypothetical protein VFN67_27060 [Polyangiales bacterium]|nr:hypothetical protein [Polyangiales bacterium]
MVSEPSGCFRPAGAGELRSPRIASAEQTRAEATIDLPADQRRDAQAHAAQVICARVLGELFGSASRRVNTALPSLYALLDARLRACDPARGDLRALAPCPEVDLALGRLVAIIQGDFAAQADDTWPNQALEQAVRVALVQQIQADPALRQRAHRLRSCAGLAETAMEQHFSRALIAELAAVQRPYVLAPAGALRTDLLERCLVNFPYMRNYLLLTAAELRLLQHPAPALLLRTPHVQALSRAQRQRFEVELAQLRLLSARHTTVAWHKQTFAVCGAGPLPVTGLMMHTLTGARVSLIERDATAVSVSRALIEQLERLQVLEAGAVRVVHADVAELTPRADVVLVASLVDDAAKLQLVQRLREAPGLQAVLLRSASSLCAELAYEPVDTLRYSDPSLPFCGESVPASDVLPRPERLLCSAKEVLNNTELYRPVQLSAAPISDVSWLRELLSQLRAAA